VETALPLAFIKLQEEAYRGGTEYPPAEDGAETEDWMFGGGKSSGGHVQGRPAAAAIEPSKSTDSAPEALASRRSRRNVGRKVYYDEEDPDLVSAMEARSVVSESTRAGGRVNSDWGNNGGGGTAGAEPTGRRGRRSTVSIRGTAAVAEPVASSAWAERAARALAEVMREEIAPPFSEPVPREVPYYYDIIKRPMDLGTIYTKLQNGQYGSPGEMYADVALVWSNCAKYNEPDSEIALAARQLEAKWRQLVSEAEVGVATRGDGGQAVGSAQVQLQRQQAEQLAQLQQQQQAQRRQAALQAQLLQQQQQQQQQQQALAAATAASAAAPAAPEAQAQAQRPVISQQALAQMQAIADVLHKLRQYDLAEPFLEPVPRDVPGYYEQIAHPVDLGTVWRRLTQGGYPSAAHVHVDVQRMFQNCYAFNIEGSDIFRIGQQVETMYLHLCREAGLM
jgi:hypothetical protein